MNELVNKEYSVIIPAYNEQRTIAHVVEQALKAKHASEVIVVNDGSTDKTEKELLKFGDDHRFKHLLHKKNKGKGAAFRTGLKHAKNEIIVFLDADLMNITPYKIHKIAQPVLDDEVDVARARFRRARGRVTEIAVKPMMRILFPDTYFDQPISGQVCAKKSFLENVNFEERWGVDIGLLLDAIQQGQRIVEVDIGQLEHKANSDEDIADMSEQVLSTMIQRAGLIQHKYKLVVFTLDNTLIKEGSLNWVFNKLGFDKEIAVIQEKFYQNKINFTEYVKAVAKLFEGINMEDIATICNDIMLIKYAQEVIDALRRRKYKVAIISSNFSPLVLPIQTMPLSLSSREAM